MQRLQGQLNSRLLMCYSYHFIWSLVVNQECLKSKIGQMLLLGALILPGSSLMYVLTECVSHHSPQNFIGAVAKIKDVSIQPLPLHKYKTWVCYCDRKKNMFISK